MILVIVAIIYICSLTCMAPMTYHINYITVESDKNKQIHICDKNWTTLSYSYYVIVMGTMVQFVPLLTIASAYTLILYEVKKNNPHLQMTKGSTQSRRRRLNTLKIQRKFIYIVGVFFILTLPYSVYMILTDGIWVIHYPQYIQQNYNIIILLHEVFFMMSVFHSSVNPLIYGNWRGVLCLCRRHSRKDRSSSTSSTITMQADVSNIGQ